ncbi:MAG: GNAT family N-acetyltransferase [Leadbetterella sp.]|nr:GNAT family N-acetyltransferase [Leadbetterella sp.]
MRYRIAKLQDKAKLKDLGLNSYGQFKNILTEENWSKLNSFLTNENSYSDLLSYSKCFVCETNDKIIGMAYIIPKGNPTEIFQTDWSYIRMVGVNTEFEGKGIGKKLIQMCIDYAKETNENIIALHTSEFINAARHIYENIGFKQIKELEPRLGKKYWLYILDLN